MKTFTTALALRRLLLNCPSVLVSSVTTIAPGKEIELDNNQQESLAAPEPPTRAILLTVHERQAKQPTKLVIHKLIPS